MGFNYVNEEFDRAYGNIGLLASDIWLQLDDYKNANLYLWIRCNEIELQMHTEVLSSIKSGSSDIDEENTCDDIGQITHKIEAPQGNSKTWLLPELEQDMTSYNNIKPVRLLNIGRDIAPAKQVATVCPSKWLTRTKWPHRLLIHHPSLPLTLQDSGNLSLFKEDIYKPCYNMSSEKLEKFPCPSFRIETGADLELYSIINKWEIRRLWTSLHPRYGDISLNADSLVPSSSSAPCRPLMYQSIYDTCYESGLFPYMDPTSVSNHEDQSMLNYEELLRISPVFPSFPNLYYSFKNTESSCDDHQLEVLSHNVSPGGSSPNSVQQTIAVLDNWLSGIYNTRSNDFTALSLTSQKIDMIYQNVLQSYLLSHNGTRFGHVNNSSFEELEREALEQYTNLKNTDKLQGSKGSTTDNTRSNVCNQNKEPVWITRKKFKQDKKKKFSKYKKKSIPEGNLQSNYGYIKCITKLINKYSKLKEFFNKTFYESDWKHVQPLLTDKVAKSFNMCLKITQEFSDWFKILLLRHYLNKENIINKKRLEIANNILNCLQELMGLMYQYISCYSKIKMTISFDSKLCSNPKTFFNPKPVCYLNDESIRYTFIFSLEEYFDIFNEYNKKVINNNSYKSVLNFNLCDNITQEWILPHTPNSCVHTDAKYYCIVGDTVQPSMFKKLQCPTWCSCMWMYTDGWRFTDNNEIFSFIWLNKFRAVSLGKVAFAAHNIAMNKWLLSYKILLNNNHFKPLNIWNINDEYSEYSSVYFNTFFEKEECWDVNLLCFDKYPFNTIAVAVYQIGLVYQLQYLGTQYNKNLQVNLQSTSKCIKIDRQD